MRPKHEQLKQDILFEQGQLDAVVQKISGIKKDAAEVNITASGAYLMNFYNGIENIMKRCAREYYKKMPKGDDWHKQLLQQSCLEVSNKAPLFNREIVDGLYQYLSFRHFFIHGYVFKLKKEKMELLIIGVDELWHKIKKQLAKFMSSI